MKKLIIFILISSVLFVGCGRTSAPFDELSVGAGIETESEGKSSPEAETVTFEDEETKTMRDDESEDESEGEKPEETTAPSSVTPTHYHNYVKAGTVASTCSAYGYETYACSCGDSYTAPLPMTAHSYSAKVIAPTDFDVGYTVTVCGVCGYSDGVWTNIVPAKLTYKEQILRLVNEERAKVGAAPLVYRDDLQKAADIRTSELNTSFSHTRPDGRDCFSVFEDIGFSDYYACGENIAYGYPDARSVMNGWMNSEGHRANILNPNYTGIVVGKDDFLNWVQLFVAS